MIGVKEKDCWDRNDFRTVSYNAKVSVIEGKRKIERKWRGEEKQRMHGRK